MKAYQKLLKLKPFPRGIHLITDDILFAFDETKDISIGFFQAHIQHTSASLTINENADPTVRLDLENYLNEMVPENQPYYQHTVEGSDDMPAHIKASLLGNDIHLPISHGSLNLGTWQGIYLCEHRNEASARNLILTAIGI